MLARICLAGALAESTRHRTARPAMRPLRAKVHRPSLPKTSARNGPCPGVERPRVHGRSRRNSGPQSRSKTFERCAAPLSRKVWRQRSRSRSHPRERPQWAHPTGGGVRLNRANRSIIVQRVAASSGRGLDPITGKVRYFSRRSRPRSHVKTWPLLSFRSERQIE